MLRIAPSLVSMSRRWSMKSKSIEKTRAPCGIGDVVNPRGVAYSVTCQEWLIQGDCTSRTFPTTWLHRCSVAQVSPQSAKDNDGQDSSMTLRVLQAYPGDNPGRARRAS